MFQAYLLQENHNFVVVFFSAKFLRTKAKIKIAMGLLIILRLLRK